MSGAKFLAALAISLVCSVSGATSENAASAHAAPIFDVQDFTYLDLKDYKNPSVKKRVRRNGGSRLIKKWTPIGTSEDPYSLACHPREMAKRYLDLPGGHKDKGQFLRNYFARCQNQLSRNTAKALVSLAAYKRIDFDVLESPSVEPFEITFRDGSSARGFLALKAGPTPRPLVIIKCGLYCEADSRAATVVLLFLHLFEENPFHVMVLENHTASSSMIRNNRFVLGGFYEGQEIFEIGRWVREESPFRKRISDLHLMGASMGGGAAVFGALVNGLNPAKQTGTPVYNSAVSFCGVVNLDQTMHEIFKKNFRSFFFAIRAFTKIKEVRDVPELEGLIGKFQLPQPEKYPEIVAEAGRRFLAQIEPKNYFFPFHLEPPVDSVEEFWRRNSIINYSHLIRTPLLVWSSFDDWMVPYPENTKLIQEKHGDDDPFVQTIGLRYGNHCGISLMYGWETTAKVFRAYIIDNSPAFKETYHQRVELIDLPKIDLAPGEIHVAQKWLAKTSHVELVYTTWKGTRRKCRKSGPFESPRRCYRHRAVRVNWAQLESLGIKKPTSPREEDRITRWMNANMEVHGQEGPLIESTEFAQKIKLWPY